MKEMRRNPNAKTHRIGLIGHYKTLNLKWEPFEKLVRRVT